MCYCKKKNSLLITFIYTFIYSYRLDGLLECEKPMSINSWIHNCIIVESVNISHKDFFPNLWTQKLF